MPIALKHKKYIVYGKQTKNWDPLPRAGELGKFFFTAPANRFFLITIGYGRF